MKIGISCYPTYGGSGIVATELALALVAGGDEVHLISYALPSRLAESHWGPGKGRLYYHEVVVPHYPLFEYPPYSLALATTMVEVAQHHELDLVHVHYAVPNAVSAVLARQIAAPRPLPVVTTLHGTDITLVGNDPSYLATTRWGIQQSDRVTTVSRALERATRDQLEIERPIEVIPNFIDPSRHRRAFESGGRARRWAQEDERIVVHISNFRPVKRIGDVIDVFHRLCQDHRVRLLLVGDGPERAKAEARCRELGICDRMTFLGNLPQVEEILVGADLFLLPSETESFGLAALEALACKVPVVATEVGGLPEVVRDGETGFLLPLGDVEGMARAGDRLLRDEEMRTRFGERAQADAFERFAMDRVVARYREVYQAAIAGSRSTEP